MPSITIQSRGFKYILVPKTFKDISGANYEVNTFNFKLPTTVKDYMYNSVRNQVYVNGVYGQDYYNKLPYYVNIVDHNNVSITGDIVHDMDDMKPNDMFGVLFYDRPLTAKPLSVFSGPRSMALYRTGGRFASLNSCFAAAAYNGIGTTRLYVDGRRVGLFLNGTVHDDSAVSNTDTYGNTRVERIAYTPIDAQNLSTNPSYGPRSAVASFATSDMVYVDTVTREQVWRYPVYEHGLPIGGDEYYDGYDNLMSQPGDDQARFVGSTVTLANAAQYVESDADSASLVAMDDYGESDEVGVDLRYTADIGELFMYGYSGGEPKDDVSVASNKTDANVVEYHYFFYYVKGGENNPNYYCYPYPTDNGSMGGNVYGQLPPNYWYDMDKLASVPKSELDSWGEYSHRNFMFALRTPSTSGGRGIKTIEYQNLQDQFAGPYPFRKLKFFILSVYNSDGCETRTVSPVISTEPIHVSTRFRSVVYDAASSKYVIDGNAGVNDEYVYIMPQFGYKLTDGNVNYNYGRDNASLTQTYGRFDISDLDYIENYDFTFGRVDITVPDGATGTPQIPNTYYTFTTKENLTVESDVLHSAGSSADYRFVCIVSVDKKNSNSEFICNVTRAIKVKVSDIMNIDDWQNFYVSDITNTNHRANRDTNAAVYEVPGMDNLSPSEFQAYVADTASQNLFTKIFTDITSAQ